MLTPPPQQPEGPWSYGLFIPHDARAVGVVRATLRAILRAARLNCIADTAELLLSELATNAYRYSRGDAFVGVDWRPSELQVSVWDRSPALPEPRTADDGDEHGRGLELVRSCADDWGVYDSVDMGAGTAGKAVWFSLKAQA